MPLQTKYVPPAVTETAFNCPHCGAFAQQSWYKALSDRLNAGTPELVRRSDAAKASKSVNLDSDPKEWRHLARLERLAEGRPFLGGRTTGHATIVHNISLSSCFNCRGISIWKYERLVWPNSTSAPAPNADLPGDVRDIYDEAGLILDKSPRAAAALLRLGIQMLCKSLGESGNNINRDIGALVKKGLNVRVQRALDVVRVVGNHSLHPGQIDIRDDQTTARNLFGLVNLIADRRDYTAETHR